MDDIVTRLRGKAEECRADEVGGTWISDLVEAANLIESFRKELAEERDETMWRFWNAKAQELAASNDALRSDISRLTKERDEARKALEPFARDAHVWASFADSEFLTEFFNDGNVPMETTITVGHLRRAAAIRQKSDVPTDVNDMPGGEKP